MPAAAVIPAPIAYIKVVVVKKLVVGSQFESGGPLASGYCLAEHFIEFVLSCSSMSVIGDRYVYFEKIRVLKAGVKARIMLHGIME